MEERGLQGDCGWILYYSGGAGDACAYGTQQAAVNKSTGRSKQIWQAYKDHLETDSETTSFASQVRRLRYPRYRPVAIVIKRSTRLNLRSSAPLHDAAGVVLSYLQAPVIPACDCVESLFGANELKRSQTLSRRRLAMVARIVGGLAPCGLCMTCCTYRCV